MKIILSVIIVVLTTTVYSQQLQRELIVLDPLIGDSISLKEKKDYYLFEFIDTLNYNYSQVYKISDTTYLLELSLQDSTFFDTTLTQSLIDLNRENIHYMKGYFEAIKQQQVDHKNEVDSLILTNTALYNPYVINGKLIVKNTKNGLKLPMKVGKYYHFKLKKKYDDAQTISLTGIEEKHLGFVYARIEKVLLVDSTIILRRDNLTLNENIIVSFDDIEFIKQNTFETAWFKSMCTPAGNVFIYPLVPFSAPICAFNLIFNKKKFDLTDNSEFRIKI